MKLFLFTTDLDLAKQAERAGVDSIIVDWETKGKDTRQTGYDLETNGDTPEDVYNLSRNLNIPVTVRVNSIGNHTSSEVDCALRNGARILMLPMARTPGQVAEFLKIVDGRAQSLIQIETQDLVEQLREFRRLNWDYAYIGLNDLMVERQAHIIWEAVWDGTVEVICRELKGRNIGFGGITVLGGGDPINFELLLHEMTRLDCSLGIMRRMFKKDILDRDIDAEVKAIRSFIDASRKRGFKAREHDRARLHSVIKGLIKKEKDKQRLRKRNRWETRKKHHALTSSLQHTMRRTG